MTRGHEFIGTLPLTPMEKQEAKEARAIADEIDQLRTQLAGCSVAAMGGTSEPTVAKREDWGWSPAYQDVLDLRRRYEVFLAGYREIVRRWSREGWCVLCDHYQCTDDCPVSIAKRALETVGI